MAFIGSVPQWEHHFQGRDADVDHDVKLLQLETKDTEIDSKIGHQGKNITTVLGYSYTANVYSDENIDLTWTGATFRFKHKMSGSRNVTRTFLSPQYNTTTSGNLSQNVDYYLNLASYDDSSYHATSYGYINVYLSERDVEKWSYSVTVWYDYYETRLEVTRLS